MKAILTGFAVLLMASCGKEMSVDTLGKENTTTTGSIRMKMDGIEWSADQLAYADLSTGSIVIFGIAKNTTNLVFSLDGISVGEYKLTEGTSNSITYADPNEAAVGLYTTGNGNSNPDDDGKVIITKIDTAKKTITGTFEMTLYRLSDQAAKTVLSGVIENVSYDPAAAIPGGGVPGGGIPGGGTGGIPGGTTGNTLTAKIDGADFTATFVNGVAGFDILLNLGGSNSTKTIALQFPLDLAVGEHAAPADLINIILTPVSTTPDPSQVMMVESGKIIITENDRSKRYMKGTFEGKMVSDSGKTSQITNGAFSVTYQ